ncbi:hypothetical protein RhiirC2_757133 [Rhizophagus irregularis]|uniref:Uncharacterized protein n=1 Tax=Rhizophagus irregularis TaxID=588596 RepID=A0A2N1MRB3_9GLOM|nr:hypothetical protein RhiirC2_757133 [Rhizophagus irregularis]
MDLLLLKNCPEEVFVLKIRLFLKGILGLYLKFQRSLMMKVEKVTFLLNVKFFLFIIYIFSFASNHVINI